MYQHVINGERNIYIGYSITGDIVFIEEYNYIGAPAWVDGCVQLPILEITEREYLNLKRLLI